MLYVCTCTRVVTTFCSASICGPTAHVLGVYLISGTVAAVCVIFDCGAFKFCIGLVARRSKINAEVAVVTSSPAERSYRTCARLLSCRCLERQS